MKLDMVTITYLMMCMIMIQYQIFYYQDVGATVKDSEYIPKSKQSKT
jgi:hypothetical protein